MSNAGGQTRATSSSFDGDVPPPWTWWDHVIDLGLTLWVVRVPLAGLLIGLAILGLAPQAQDLFVERSMAGPVAIAWFLLLHSLVWAAPTHYAARLLIETDQRYQHRLRLRGTWFAERLGVCTPRVLGTATYGAMIIAVWRSWLNLPDLTDRAYYDDAASSLAIMGALLLIVSASFFAFTVYRKQIVALPILAWAERLAAWLVRPVGRLVPPFMVPRHRKGEARMKGSDLGPVLLIALTLIFAFLPLVVPLWFAEMFPRAASVAFIIGGWIPLLSYIAGMGREWRAPVLTVILLVVTFLPSLVGHNYEVRRIESTSTIADLVAGAKPDAIGALHQRVNLNDAVAWWKRANCKDKTCPRPIIIAAAGGASRAGFFTAGVIGQLLDDKLNDAIGGHKLTETELANRIFAVSGVSGSSVGAVMTVAALAVAENGKQPCQVKTFELWRGYYRKENIGGWRSCLEALMSGDFLTPVFAGFVFRDTIGFLSSVVPWPDRAALIEQAWERQFENLVGTARASEQLTCSGSLKCPFMSLRPTADRWLPLLVLNGTSVGTGHRIVTTILDNKYQPGQPAGPSKPQCPLQPRATECELFANGFLFHDLLGPRAGTKLDDVRLSTAAHNSARFPLISPPGEIRDSTGRIRDRIVDGGYFENFGAYTAGELAQAIRAVDSELNPFVLVLSNDPQVPIKVPTDGKQQIRVRTVAPAPEIAYHSKEGSFVTDLSGPISAIMNARNARGLLAVDELTSILDGYDLSACNVVEIKVWGQPARGDAAKARNLSMSWWLSKPVQIYLHEQTDFDIQGEPVSRYNGNREMVAALLAALRMPVPPSSAVRRCPQ